MRTIISHKSPLHEMTQSTPTSLWNDSASIEELKYSIEHGAVGATCNPVIVVDVLKKEMHLWRDPIRALIREMPTATENQIARKLVEAISKKLASCFSAFSNSTADGTEDCRCRQTPAFTAIRTRSSRRRSIL